MIGNIPINPPIMTRLHRVRVRMFCLFLAFSACNATAAGSENFGNVSDFTSCFVSAAGALSVSMEGFSLKKDSGVRGGCGGPFNTIGVADLSRVLSVVTSVGTGTTAGTGSGNRDVSVSFSAGVVSSLDPSVPWSGLIPASGPSCFAFSRASNF